MKEIKLTQNKVAIVDDEDFIYLSKHKWCCGDGYAQRRNTIANSKSTAWKMHWEIMGKPEKGYNIDHINGDKLDNRRCNLRVCSGTENIRNRKTHSNNKSGYKGVWWRKDRHIWNAKIKVDDRIIHLGQFKNKEDAAIAYNNAAIKYHKKFAKLNTIQ